MVPSDGRNGGLAMLWREGIDVRFKSCSNSHIDVVVFGVQGRPPWRATGFYRHPNASKRHTSWKLLEMQKIQCEILWVVFGDFNKITQSDEKLGWLDRDAEQMKNFRDCLSFCGITDLGFVGKRVTWCNERFANEEWRRIFPEAIVHHMAMSASNH